MESGQSTTAESWRIVLLTNLPNGLLYHIVRDVLGPQGHKVVGVLTSAGPKRRRTRDYLSVVEVLPPGIDVIVSNHPERWAAMLAPLHPDLIICAGMPWLIPPEVVALPRLGAINFHPAALPKHRGPNAVEWAIRSGDPELGFSIHRIGGDFDNGPILAQGAVPIDDDDDMRTLLGKFGPLLPKLLGQAIARVARGEAGDPQDESKASYAGMLEPEWREIDWSRSAREIHNQIRSWTGFREVPHGAFGEVDGDRLQITRTRLLPEPATGSPGAVLRRDGETIVIQCGDAPLALVDWRPAEVESA